ncbi:hypothetical protein LCGC14_1772220, partial [marine sediment metagenome]
MPKIPITFNSFEKGENTATDPRDLGKGYLAGCVNMMVDEVGIIRTMGAPENHDAQGDTGQPAGTVSSMGRGLFAFSHDRIGGANSDNMAGTHTGGAAEAVLTDSSGAFMVDSLIGATVTNTTNSESATITDNNATTVTGALSGGETWDNGDTYTITDFPETSDDYIVWVVATSALVKIWSKENAEWSPGTVLDLGTSAQKPTFTLFDGGLRITDGAFGATTKWYGYIERRKFRTATTPTYNYTDNNWFAKGNDLTPPLTTGVFLEDGDSLQTTGTVGEVNVKLHTTLDANKPEAEWQKKWECGVTYVYDTTQETLISILGGETSPDTYDLSGATTLSAARFEIQIFGDATNRVNERLTHVKVYIREHGTQEWFTQGVWELQEGGRLINGDERNLWTAVDTTNDYYKAFNTSGTQPIPQILHTWESETGLFNDEKSIDIGQTGDGYGASVVIGRTVYVGNVKRTNFDGESLIEADAIYKSIPDQPDTFPASWRIDAAINDGEGITALHKWGKELLQFKHRTLYIIDTSGETEILTHTFKKAGARNASIIADTPFGIVWANEWGLWLYDGELQSLLSQDRLGNTFFTNVPDEAPRPRHALGEGIVEQSAWSTFISASSYLGYYAYKQQIIIGDKFGTAGAGNIYIYDFRTGSIVRGLAKMTASVKHTNFITDSDDDLVIMHTTGTIVKWGDTETATTGQQVDFPEVGTLGKLFRTKECSVTYKSSVTQATPLYYRTNGSASWSTFASENFADTGDGTSEGWSRLVFDASSFIEAETIQLKLDFPSSGIVQIND